MLKSFFVNLVKIVFAFLISGAALVLVGLSMGGYYAELANTFLENIRYYSSAAILIALFLAAIPTFKRPTSDENNV